jgi:8-oxo-dGTP pyrophosphatase MutT (NUDIX family)
MPREIRPSVRAILIDPADRVLLLRGRDPELAQGADFWFTPGGGVEAGEEPLQALRRELWEELGQRVGPLAGPVAQEQSEFAFAGRWLRMDSAFYWARVPSAFDPAPQALTEMEERFLLGWRWFAVAELDDTFGGCPVYPRGLAAIVAGLLR